MGGQEGDPLDRRQEKGLISNHGLRDGASYFAIKQFLGKIRFDVL